MTCKRLQIPPRPHRCHYVRAKVRVHEYEDGAMAIFHGTRRLARYNANGRLRAGGQGRYGGGMSRLFENLPGEPGIDLASGDARTSAPVKLRNEENALDGFRHGWISNADGKTGPF